MRQRGWPGRPGLCEHRAMSKKSETIRQHRGKLAFTFLLFAAMTVVIGVGAWICSFLRDALWAYVGVSSLLPLALACGFVAVMSGMAWLQPATLTLSEDGVCYRTFRSERRIAWSEIAEFFVLPKEGYLRSPACFLVEGRRCVSFGRAWEKSPEEIVEALKEAKEKWGDEGRDILF
jgi:hypothetical protein